jgi:hypothetical protein
MIRVDLAPTTYDNALAESVIGLVTYGGRD